VLLFLFQVSLPGKLFAYMLITFVLVFVLLQPLSLPGRFIIGEGILSKMCRKKPKLRQFFLFSDILVYGNIVFQGKKVSFVSRCCSGVCKL